MALLHVRSIVPKIDEIRYFLQCVHLDIFTISETWLDKNVDSSEIAVSGYNLLRVDRNRHGGGVALYIKNHITFNLREDLTHDDTESIWIEVRLPNQPPVLVCYL